ncbi:hypothetical protein EDEG_03780 [Edhazardia aedis USNM 41457]|uniref:Uncharacterized protein n=1 Tax=Edhazardia aedis (strain USNM 41457) TaxID=1003232 RepID=J9DGH5_EDHAE|nr:hypothetical protein EDEG_03780 [Edhazardia aedis USNM 41457]|eukprot:EJW01700.1 hypothetical protein EDEG_03780 [Edhazardia aedis USNM 41457]
MDLNHRFSEALKRRDSKISKINSIKEQTSQISSHNNILIDVLAIQNNRDLITESFYNVSKKEIRDEVEKLRQKEHKNNERYIINSNLSIINIGNTQDLKEVSTNNESQYMYPVGYIAVRIYRRHKFSRIERENLIYTCEIRILNGHLDLVIMTEDGFILNGINAWNDFHELFDEKIDFNSIESFYGLDLAEVQRIIRNNNAINV